jgi:hypothetical protein
VCPRIASRSTYVNKNERVADWRKNDEGDLGRTAAVSLVGVRM